MSNHLISLAYSRNLRTVMRNSLMILFADKASDDGGGIYASKQTMADELCCSRQAIIDTIKGFLADEPPLIVKEGNIKNNNGFTVVYSINVDALMNLPLVNCHAKRSSRLTRQAGLHVKQIDSKASSRLTQTLIKPDYSEKGKTVDNLCPLSERPLPSNLDIGIWESYLAMRKAIRKDILRPGARYLLQKLDNLADHWHVGDIVERAIIRCWTDFEAPSPNGWSGIRRITDGRAVKPVKADETILEAMQQIDRLDDINERLERRAVMFAKQPRRGSAVSIGDLTSKFAGKANG